MRTPPFPNRPPSTHGQQIIEFFQGSVAAIPKMELEDDGAGAGPRLGRPEHGGGFDPWGHTHTVTPPGTRGCRMSPHDVPSVSWWPGGTGVPASEATKAVLPTPLLPVTKSL